MRADKRDYRVVLLPAMWRESFKETKPFKCKINSFIDKLAMVKMILKKPRRFKARTHNNICVCLLSVWLHFKRYQKHLK